MITLPLGPRERATFRILWMPGDQWTAADGQPWEILPVPAIYNRSALDSDGSPAFGTLMAGTVAQGGYHVGRITRWCLPDEDRAEFYIDVGLINGVTVDPIDLTGYTDGSPGCAVKIQVLDDETFPNGVTTLPSGVGSAWKTVFVGYVFYQTHVQQPGATGQGRVTYYCSGVLSRTRDWPLDRHTTAQAPHAKGHPGYNVPLHGWFRKVIGNRAIPAVAADPFGDMGGENGYPDISTYYGEHTLPLDASGYPWTDEAAVQHALASSRAVGEPLIEASLSINQSFSGTFAWPVFPGTSCLDFLQRICNRQRGRGSVFMSYLDGSDPDGNVRMILTSYPSFAGTLTYLTPATPGALAMTQPNTIAGAELGYTAVAVDINGDHRVTDDGLRYDNRASSVVDMLIMQGEPIQVLCNLNFFGSSLTKRWSDTDAASFAAIPATNIFQLTLPRWRQVWRRYGIPSAASPWNYEVKSEPSDSFNTINFYCDNDGSVQTNAVAGTTYGCSSEMTVRVLPDLPIYEGWRYDVSPPVRWDGSVDYLPPGRMPPVVMYQGETTSSGGRPCWLPLSFAGFQIQTDDFGMLITHPIEDQTGARLLAPNSDPHFQRMEKVLNLPILADVDTTAGIDTAKLNTIVGLELGTRPQVSYNVGGPSGDYQAISRRLTMTIDGLHLWIGAGSAIWELDYANASLLNYPPGLKFPSAGVPTILRDDRSSLAFAAALGWYYYGAVHNPATWALRDCGLLTSFTLQNGSTVDYPTLGQLVSTITYRGAAGSEVKATISTPITCIDYNHADGLGETRWHTDYVRYDANIQ